jgi:hypothetical protein
MSNNLIVSYDLNVVGQNYSAVIDAIKSLGGWTKIQQSVWYVDSPLNAELAAKKVNTYMDRNDLLIVLDATNNVAFWYNLSGVASKQIQGHWGR